MESCLIIQLTKIHEPDNMATQRDIFSIIAEDRKAPNEEISQLISEKYNVIVDDKELINQKKMFNNRYSRGKKRKSLSVIIGETYFLYK